MTKDWLMVRLRPAEYAKLIGHSEHFVRNWCMPEKLRNDPEARIELRFPTTELLANCDKLTTIGSNERR
jgi:hypothetical protein